jgi:hypothetical protein
MRRISLIAMALAALALAVPGAALAHGRSHHPKKSHRVRHSHRVRSHIRHFVAANPTAPPTTTTPSDNAGTVASFTGGVLTLTLNDGSTVSGKVTAATEIECQSAMTVSGDARRRGADRGPGGDNGGDNQGGGDQGDDNGGGEDNGGGNGATCDSAALVSGAVVHGADLKVDSTGATFRKIEIVQ